MTRREILAWERLKNEEARLILAVPEALPFCKALEQFLGVFVVGPKTLEEDREALFASDEPLVG